MRSVDGNGKVYYDGQDFLSLEAQEQRLQAMSEFLQSLQKSGEMTCEQILKGFRLAASNLGAMFMPAVEKFMASMPAIQEETDDDLMTW